MTLHIVTDIETLGFEPGCEIRALGACAFVEVAGASRWPGPTFYVQTCNDISYDGAVDKAVLDWWRQGKGISKLARRHVLGVGNRTNIFYALEHYLGWVHANSKAYHDHRVIHWGNGPDFDHAILAFAIKVCGFQVPWKYYDLRDYRTAMDMVGGVKLRRRTVRHHALHDAVHEARKIMLALELAPNNRFGGKP